MQLEKTVAMTLKADAAVVSVKCAPAAEPFPNERSKGDPDHVCSGPRETQDEKKHTDTHTRTQAHTHTHTHKRTHSRSQF